MLKLITYFLLITITTFVECKYDYEYIENAQGWFKLHKVIATWAEAFFQCRNEGAELASPLSEEMIDAMAVLSGKYSDQSFYIGTHARFSSRHFVSIEGIPLDEMPVRDMVKALDLNIGECLSMDDFRIRVVPCWKRLPYMCYKKYDSQWRFTECGTIDTEYKFERNTGSCYKIHMNPRTWPEAYSQCISEGGYLAILNDSEEARIVANMFPDIHLNITNDRDWDQLYIGIRDWDEKGTYMTIHGEPLTYLFNEWAEDQPDSLDQQCASLIRTGKLDNFWCDVESLFVCEKDPRHNRYGELKR